MQVLTRHKFLKSIPAAGLHLVNTLHLVSRENGGARFVRSAVISVMRMSMDNQEGRMPPDQHLSVNSDSDSFLNF